MATILEDGTVIASYLGVENRGTSSGGQQIMNTFSLQIGEVSAIYYPKDQGNQSKIYIEYDVEVRFKEGSDGRTITQYKNCIAVSSFGSVADRTDTTYRVSTEESNPGQWGDGAKVLLLCIGGNRNRSVILGGISTTDRQSKTGHSYTFEFNGINFHVNNAGEVSVTRKGITNGKGKYLEKDVTTGESTNVPTTGATIFMHKDGSIGIQDSSGQNIVLTPEQEDTAMGLTNIGLDQVALDTFNANWTVHGNFRVNATKAVQSNSGGGTVQNGTIFLQPDPESNVILGDGTDAMLKGSTYRESESQSNNINADCLNSIASQLQESATILNSATPNTASLAATLQKLSADFKNLQMLFSKMSQSIKEHEGKSETFESRHFLD